MSVTVVLCVRLPLVPVMIRVYVPGKAAREGATVSVEEPEPPLIELGLKLPVAPVGKPITLKATLPVNPEIGEIPIV